MRRAALSLLLALLAWASVPVGCTDPDVGGKVWQCETADDCLAGFACVQGACRPTTAPEDGGDGGGGPADGDVAAAQDVAAPDVGPDATPCACSSGPCCDGCRFLPDTQSCGTAVEFACAGGPACGGIVMKRPVAFRCSGTSSACNGVPRPTGPWVVSRTCPLSHVCAEGNDYCREDGACAATGTCTPACDGAACQRCEDGTCRSACDAAACLGCNGAGSCRSLCDVNGCETCDGAGQCLSRCAPGFACDGAGGCVAATGCAPACDAAACRVCGAGQTCLSTCRASDCEVCDGAGHCRSTCDAATERCSGGRCVPLVEPPCHDPATRAFCEASILSRIAITTADASCDLTGDGLGDNALAGVFVQVEPLGGTSLAQANESIAEFLRTGAVIELLEYVELADDPANTPALSLLRYEGRDADSDPTNNLYGGAAFLVAPGSLDPGGEAVVRLADGRITSGLLGVEGGRLPIRGLLAFLGPYDAVSVSGVQLFAQLSTTATGVSLGDGLLCGYLRITDLVAAANAFTARECACLGLPGGLLFLGSDLTCIPFLDASGCDGGGNEAICAEMASLCTPLLLFGSGFADIDSDGDGTADALSVGIEFTAVPARITGVAAQ